jgi:hypothetical protein
VTVLPVEQPRRDRDLTLISGADFVSLQRCDPLVWSVWRSGLRTNPGPYAPFHRRAATLETLRMDRQLDEALTHGADPLHLAVVFGLDETTAIRYSTAARKLLLTPAEQQHPS